MLYISQPTISTHIRALEEELQSRLVLRTTKDVEITPRGWELYQCAEKIFLLRDSLVESWQMETEQVINLGASTIPSVYILPEVLPGFLKANSGIQIHIHQGDSREIISQVLEGNIKLGMVGMKVSDENLTFLPFYRDTMVLITPATEYYRKWKDEGGSFYGEASCRAFSFAGTGERKPQMHGELFPSDRNPGTGSSCGGPAQRSGGSKAPGFLRPGSFYYIGKGGRK